MKFGALNLTAVGLRPEQRQSALVYDEGFATVNIFSGARVFDLRTLVISDYKR